MKVLAINCSLKSSQDSEPSSTDVLLNQLLAAFRKYAVEGEVIRAADFNIRPGVSSDEGHGDAWPGLLQKVLEADILLIGTPIWLGQPSSISKRVVERMDAFLGQKDERGRMPSYNKIAIVAVVGNEDGAHHVIAELCQALTEVGFTVPAGGGTYWVGEAMQTKDYKDLEQAPRVVADWNTMLVSNAAHLAGLLKRENYPGVPT